MGLNRKEIEEFIFYWKPYLEQSPFNLITFIPEEFLPRLEITPQPDHLIRIYMIFTKLKTPNLSVEPQILPQIRREELEGFVAVELGGYVSEDLNNLNPILPQLWITYGPNDFVSIH